MSGMNIEIFGRAIDAFNRGDYEGALALCHSEVEWVGDPRVSGARTRRGHAEVKHYLESIPRYWEELCLEPERFVDRGDQLLVLARMTARTRRGGLRVERQFDQVITLRDGKIVRGRWFLTREEALEAAGLRADAPSVSAPNRE
jgi:ketosteroid isomerase-like protein